MGNDYFGMGQWGANPAQSALMSQLYGTPQTRSVGNLPTMPAMPGTGAPVPGAGQPIGGGFDWGSMQSWLGGSNVGPNGAITQQMGIIPTALNSFSGLASAYMGMKQYGLAKDELRENKRQFNMNFESQQKLTNSQLADRQKARVASNPGFYESVGSYMGKYGV